jgi:hypothetical protein
LKRVAVIQSNYVPWKGYFDIIHDVDLFIFHDDVQYTKNDWRNRNKVKVPGGTTWLTIPVGDQSHQLIYEVTLENPRWQRAHFAKLYASYGKTPCWTRYADFLEYVYREREWTHLSDLNQFLTQHIAHEFLGIEVEFRDSREYSLEGRRLERLLELLGKAEATRYVSGPSARDYIVESKFEEAGIELVYKDYAGYPEYPQFYPPFEHGVSILDLLFHAGEESPYFIWGWREGRDQVKGGG